MYVIKNVNNVHYIGVFLSFTFNICKEKVYTLIKY